MRKKVMLAFACPPTSPVLIFHLRNYGRTPLVRTLGIRIANYPDRLDPSCKFVQNSTKLIVLKLPVIKSSTEQCYGF